MFLPPDWRSRDTIRVSWQREQFILPLGWQNRSRSKVLESRVDGQLPIQGWRYKEFLLPGWRSRNRMVSLTNSAGQGGNVSQEEEHKAEEIQPRSLVLAGPEGQRGTVCPKAGEAEKSTRGG